MNLDPRCRALAGIIAHVALVEISVSGIGIRNHWIRITAAVRIFEAVFQTILNRFNPFFNVLLNSIFGVFFLPSSKNRHIAKILNLDTYMDVPLDNDITVSSALQQILEEL